MLCLVSPSSSPTPLPPPRRSRSHADRAAPPGIAGGGNVRLSVLSVQCKARRSGVRKVKSKFATAATVQEDKTMATAKGDVDHLPIYDLDPKLEIFKDHFRYRMKRFLEQKGSIEENEGSLESFSKGYLKFGINTNEDGTVYREWAPAAQEAELIGDFNDWNGANHKMEKDKFGVWSIKIDHVKGKPAIPHNSKVKFRFLHGGVWVDRIPALIRYATVDASKFGAPYDGVHWDPPASERYTFKHPRPSKPAAPRIYEAHVGMSGEKPAVSTYREFADNVLPRIRANNYNTVQLMAVMEHSYYASFGYHVTNFFAVSSRSGTPEDLKYLVDKAHSLGLRVLMDVVHSHASNNVTDGLNGYDVGQSTQESYFHAGDRGYHKLWDSRLFNYANWEVLRFLLSNLRYWLDEFMFDGFRFDGVTSMLYHHHGINVGFTGNYQEYFSLDTAVDAVVYMMLANHLMHKLLPEATVVAEDVSGMPVLCRPVDEGGVGFDYRLAMAIPDRWIDYLKNKDDSEWSMGEIAHTLTNRRYTEKCIAYAESHDQSIVGDKTIAFLLMDKEMYTGMSDLQPASPTIDRGIALQKMIHFITMALGGDGYLNFMGNEFGHPEWIDFPREGNNWSYDKCRRQWSLVDTDHLRYKYMNAFDQAMNALDERFSFLSSSKQIVSDMNDEEKVIVFERGDLVFVFNFHPKKTYEGYKVGCDLPGKYRVALDSDALVFGGHGRVGHDVDHFTSPEGVPGVPETNFNNRPNSFKVLSPPRTCVAYYRVDEAGAGRRLHAKAETGKTSPAESIDVKASRASSKEDKEATAGGKKGWKFARQPSDQDTK
ncbi:starch branching enzyme 1 [Zea mays]|uniref:1,4-alpha-glucan branching enzyme n=4 Tax=Zea mays TaxID=4577 RepID=Q41740_MAIZE|nr:starch branching enzyme 1 [Zea mays]AAA82735.1 starch branching enzyme I [Zea mays]AAC36471.1 starch branching enzyme I [Zea mays]ACG32270.1 1,4-alpha-glucan branching enzyme [Zea mays]ACN28680.1 unknown [Zea mays]ALN66063.1 starch branching enzyme I [Zea mays]|eukprot:NP_001105370.1 starch branching enzyme 1 [Zea mays]